MLTKLKKYTIHSNASLLQALAAINENKNGFLVIIDEDGRLSGAVTDGDIRRHIIQMQSIEGKVSDIYYKYPRIISCHDNMSFAADAFKEEGITFLPIVDSNGRLVNIITKRQFHSLLLQDIDFDFNYDFESVDSRLVDSEIFQRPWGFYKTAVYNDYFQLKVISVKPGGILSLQKHKHREEYWIIVHGEGMAVIVDSERDVKCGDTLFIPKGAVHRLSNSSRTDSLILAEVQIGDYLGEDDIIRMEDKYGRV